MKTWLLVLLCTWGSWEMLSGQTRALDSLLIEHIIMDDYAAAEDALSNGANPTAANFTGWAALQYAACSPNYRFLPLLIQYGAYHSEADGTPHPVLVAAKYGDYKHLMQLQQAGYDLQVRLSPSVNALFLAVQVDNEAAARFLMGQGVPSSLPFDPQHSALHVAAEYNALSCIEFLLGQGLSPNQANAQEETPLSLAVDRGHAELCDLLLQNGGHANAMTRIGNTLLQRAIFAQSNACLSHLLNAGATPLIPDVEGEYPLHTAAQTGQTQLLLSLLRPGSDRNVINRQGHTPLALAITSGQASAARLLIRNGANPQLGKVPPVLEAILQHDTEAMQAHLTNRRDAQQMLGGKPLLHWAILVNGPREMVQALLDAGANPLAKDENKNSVFHHIVQTNRTEWWELFEGQFKNEANTLGVTPLQKAVQLGRTELVRKFLGQAAPPYTVFSNGWTLLHLAVAEQVDPALLQALLAAGMAPNQSDGNQVSALEMAAAEASFGLFRMLVQAQMERDDAFAQGPLARRALAQACKAGRQESVTYLIRLGVNPNDRASRAAALASKRWDTYRVLIRAIRQG